MLNLILLATALAQPVPELRLSAAPPAPGGSHTLAREVPLARWSDRPEVVVATLPAGTELSLVLTQGELARVRHGIDYGWVPLDALQAIGAETPTVTPTVTPTETPTVTPTEP